MLVRSTLGLFLLCAVLPISGCAVQTYDGKHYHYVYSQEPEIVYAYLHDRARGVCGYIGSESTHQHCLSEFAERIESAEQTLASNQTDNYHLSLGETREQSTQLEAHTAVTELPAFEESLSSTAVAQQTSKQASTLYSQLVE